MGLKLIHRTLLIEPDSEMMAIDTNQNVLDVVNRGLIVLSEKNTLMKIPNTAKVAIASKDCHYRFKTHQNIWYDQFCDGPWHEENGTHYRFIKEWDVFLVKEDD